jgi:hypothetical protein
MPDGIRNPDTVFCSLQRRNVKRHFVASLRETSSYCLGSQLPSRLGFRQNENSLMGGRTYCVLPPLLAEFG